MTHDEKLAIAVMERDAQRDEAIRLRVQLEALQVRVSTLADEVKVAMGERDAWLRQCSELVAKLEATTHSTCDCCICRGLEGAMLLPRELASDPRIRNTLELYGDFCHAE